MSSQEFSKWRAFFWPVHGYEFKRFGPMLGIFFLLMFDYNVLKCLKDTLVVTAKGSGAEVIPFIKVWAMFPMSLVLTWLFLRLSNRLSREKVVYTILGIFLVFFGLFAFWLYPHREQLHAHELADSLQIALPEGCKGFVMMVRYWTFTGFYVMSELWSNIVLSLLVWGFVNQVTRLDEARRFYGVFGVGINASGIVAGQVSIWIGQYASRWGAEAWNTSFAITMGLVLAAGLGAIALFVHLGKDQPEVKPAAATPERPKLSMRENFRYLATSKYIMCLALIIIAYNIVINLVEVLWKQELRELCPDPLAYNLYMNEVTTIIGVIATCTALFVSGNVIRFFGWTWTALITPAILLLTSVGFFAFFFLKGTPHVAHLLVGVSPLALTVFFGSLQNCLSRAAKYTVFDATKEMAFVPLSSEDKVKGKAAIDGVCNRLGKSTGSVIYQALLVGCGTITACAPWVGIVLFAIIAVWILSVKSLGRQFQALSGTTVPQGDLVAVAA